jgi:endonuclease YncB( thermonuclease family)
MLQSAPMADVFRFPVVLLTLVVVLAGLLPGAAHAERRTWERLDNCRYEDNPGANDADSFQVRCGKRQFVLRLYSVDAPEPDAALAERVSEQAGAFGVRETEVVRFGRQASRQVRRRLFGRDFTIWTHWAEVGGYGRLPRYYGNLEVDGGDLGQWLLSQGLARVKGSKITAPRGGSAADLQRRLHVLELRARRDRRGLWGVSQTVAASRESS